jgi:hypothetical protein
MGRQKISRKSRELLKKKKPSRIYECIASAAAKMMIEEFERMFVSDVVSDIRSEYRENRAKRIEKMRLSRQARQHIDAPHLYAPPEVREMARIIEAQEAVNAG